MGESVIIVNDEHTLTVITESMSIGVVPLIHLQTYQEASCSCGITFKSEKGVLHHMEEVANGS